jgi:hypothetical protein
MRWLTVLRYIAYARRAVLALERIATSLDRQSQIAQLRWERSHPIRASKLTTDFGTMDPVLVAERWRKDREADGEEISLEGEE